MTTEENSGIEQSPRPPADAISRVQGNAPTGLVAGPLRMGIAGLLIGLLGWQFVHWTHPYFEIPDVPVQNQQTLTEDEERQMSQAGWETEVKNIILVGLIMGAMGALTFALVEGVSQGTLGRALAITCVAIMLAGALGAAGGYLSLSFQRVYQSAASMEPMTRSIGTQGIFWLLMASGIGLGVALFAGRASLVMGTLLQAILAAVLFVIVYVPLTAFLFPTDNAECTIPPSTGNIAVWSIGAFGLMGLMLGMSRVRIKKGTDSQAE